MKHKIQMYKTTIIPINRLLDSNVLIFAYFSNHPILFQLWTENIDNKNSLFAHQILFRFINTVKKIIKDMIKIV